LHEVGLEIAMPQTRILIADDHEVVIEGIKSVLRNREGFDVVGEALDGRQALELVAALKPDIVIMDISMPNLNGVEATRQIKKLFAGTHVIIYTVFTNEEYVIELFKAGISGYVLKQAPFSDLVLAINAVKAGGTFFSTKAPTVLSDYLKTLEEQGRDKSRFGLLSQREYQVFELLADGKSVKEIGQELCISPKTVESHKYNIMAKLGVRNVTELTKIAIREKLIPI